MEWEKSSRFCSICNRPIARESTANNSFKGMLIQHLKFKHKEAFKKYREKKIDYPDLFYLKELTQEDKSRTGKLSPKP